MASLKTIISEQVQEHLQRANWHAAIHEMEKLFSIDRDPLIRVRIGDLRRKLDRTDEAIREYLGAADLFAEKGFVVKALAQYGLVLRLDSSNADARWKREWLRSIYPVAHLRREPVEYRPPEEFGSTSTEYLVFRSTEERIDMRSSV